MARSARKLDASTGPELSEVPKNAELELARLNLALALLKMGDRTFCRVSSQGSTASDSGFRALPLTCSGGSTSSNAGSQVYMGYNRRAFNRLSRDVELNNKRTARDCNFLRSGYAWLNPVSGHR
jgi:hypothetical protein